MRYFTSLHDNISNIHCYGRPFFILWSSSYGNWQLMHTSTSDHAPPVCIQTSHLLYHSHMNKISTVPPVLGYLVSHLWPTPLLWLPAVKVVRWRVRLILLQNVFIIQRNWRLSPSGVNKLEMPSLLCIREKPLLCFVYKHFKALWLWD